MIFEVARRHVLGFLAAWWIRLLKRDVDKKIIRRNTQGDSNTLFFKLVAIF